MQGAAACVNFTREGRCKSSDILSLLLSSFKPGRQSWISLECLGETVMERRGDKFDVNNLSVMFPLPLFWVQRIWVLSFNSVCGWTYYE